ncbi:response regulator transcription factor [Fluviibacter phosphoraccumulans]|jgi:two-component system phosphate regulon response regulator OmpR|uniref:response regulator transcription factor n=1 Tax=Fluviibacter phosphoraccumulans TaxID=1751046 RepID=UPI0010B831E3|nr:response regulator transcription factor [Fluviibacter phosphoraccumulans]BCA64751.1 DNA-binding response regulator [Fluviibacter phosphoraccumulans]
MDANLKIALVEDNDDLRDLLVRDIQRAGFVVQWAECAEDLDDLAAHTTFDLLILDLNLPGEDGLSIAQRYKRANPGCYIIMLTARSRLEDKVAGYESGADIYLTKPVSSAELIAAIKSLARRLMPHAANFELVLNVRQMVLTGVNSVELNRQEAVMLKALSESVNGNLPYYRLLELCGDEVVSEIAKATLEVRIVRLRKKLAEVGVEGKSIRAIRGEGYQLLQRIKVV